MKAPQVKMNLKKKVPYTRWVYSAGGWHATKSEIVARKAS